MSIAPKELAVPTGSRLSTQIMPVEDIALLESTVSPLRLVPTLHVVSLSNIRVANAFGLGGSYLSTVPFRSQCAIC
jgi:hypothetical protein